MTVNIPLTIENERQESIRGNLRIPPISPIPCPTVIICPPLFGQERSRLLPAIGEALLSRGVAVVEYESLSPLQPGSRPTNQTQPTLSQRSSELAWVVTHLFERMFEQGNAVDIRKIGVVGHGFGAAVALHRSSQDTRLRAVSLTTPKAHANTGFDTTVQEAWSRNADALISEDGLTYSLSPHFEKDWNAQGSSVIPKAMEELKVPVSIVSGTQGREDSIAAARRLFFRQPQWARMKTYETDDKFSGQEDRVATHIAAFFADQWRVIKRASPKPPAIEEDTISPRTVL